MWLGLILRKEEFWYGVMIIILLLIVAVFLNPEKFVEFFNAAATVKNFEGAYL